MGGWGEEPWLRLFTLPTDKGPKPRALTPPPPLQAIDIISDVRTEPCGNIRRINVEIPSLSLSGAWGFLGFRVPPSQGLGSRV